MLANSTAHVSSRASPVHAVATLTEQAFSRFGHISHAVYPDACLCSCKEAT